MSLHAEICEQPQRLAALLAGQRGQVERIAVAIRDRDVRFAFLAARGTSDNAGRYAMYLWGARNGLPLALAAPSLFTFYQQPPRLRDALVESSACRSLANRPTSCRCWRRGGGRAA